MELMISKLDNGYLLSYYDDNVYKTHREAFIKQSEMIARCKELLNDDEKE